MNHTAQSIINLLTINADALDDESSDEGELYLLFSETEGDDKNCEAVEGCDYKAREAAIKAETIRNIIEMIKGMYSDRVDSLCQETSEEVRLLALTIRPRLI